MSDLKGNIVDQPSGLGGDIPEQDSGFGGNMNAQMVIGLPGKSAYQYALEAGYTGTEQEFAQALAKIDDSGSVDEETVRQIVADYLAENPPVTEETDPTVPEWAKQENPPTYTAEDVGARPDDWMPTAEEVGALPADTKIPSKPEDIGAQPKGDYLTKVPDGYAKTSDIPTKVSQLNNDAGYLTDHQDISGKLDADKLPDAIEDALAQAAASGEFDGKPGDDGISPTVKVSAIDGGHRMTITDADGTRTADIMDGEDGNPGVYVGSGDMPDGYDVQIDPNGEVLSIPQLVQAVIAALPVYDGEVVAE